MKDVAGRVAVVTGGASGIGAAMARRFVDAGMKVVVSDVDEAALARTVAELRATSPEVLGVRTDVSSRGEIESLAEQTLAEFGHVHVLCNNAGVVLGGRVEQLTDAEWNWVLGIDLWGPIHGVRIFLPLIEAEGEGHIVSTASTSGMAAPPFIAPYAVAKAGVVGLMESLRRELTERSSPIGASVLVPGPVRTPLVAASADQARALGSRSQTAEGDHVTRASGAMLQNTGIDPADVATMVLDAIVADRFWIITHEEWKDVLRKRLELMLTDGSLGERPMPAPE